MAKHQTSTSPMRSRAVLGALPIAATLVTMSAGTALGGTAFASEHHGGQDHHGQHSARQGQAGALDQSSASSAPATQYAPAGNISFFDLGGEHGGEHGGDGDEHGREHGRGGKHGHGEHGHGERGHGKGGRGEHRSGQSIDNHADNDARARSGNSGGVDQQQRGGHGKHGDATQTGSLDQESEASAPASQYAPARNVSIVGFGGKQEIDNHPSNSAHATSGNSGGVDQQQRAGGKGGGEATQTGTPAQGSSASAPASQYAPASNFSVLSFGGTQEIDNHPSNSASATSGNSGGVHQQQG